MHPDEISVLSNPWFRNEKNLFIFFPHLDPGGVHFF